MLGGGVLSFLDLEFIPGLLQEILQGFSSVFIAAASVELVLGDLYSLLLKCVLSSSQADFRG